MIILLVLFISLHLLITILFTIRIGTWKTKETQEQPSISIIIAARNEADNLRLLIPNLLNQEYQNFEISIGLDRCIDDSVDVLSSFNNPDLKWIDIQEVPSDWNGKKYALSSAIEQSSGEWLVFTDADCEPFSDHWFSSLAREIDEKTNIIIGVSPYISTNSWLSKLIQFEAFMTYFLYLGLSLFKRPYMAVGRNMAIRRSFFESSNGYQPIKGIVGGDDDLFIQKTNRSCIAVIMGKESLVFTNPKSKLKDYIHQKIRHLSVGKYYSLLDSFLLSSYHFLHMGIYLLMILYIGTKYLLPIILIYLFIKFVSYRFVADKVGAGFNYMLLPIVDVVYAFMIPIIGIWSKFKKDIEWKN